MQVMEGYSRRMQIRVYHPDAGPGGETQLKHVMLLQARRLARVLTGKEAAYEPFKSK